MPLCFCCRNAGSAMSTSSRFPAAWARCHRKFAGCRRLVRQKRLQGLRCFGRLDQFPLYRAVNGSAERLSSGGRKMLVRHSRQMRPVVPVANAAAGPVEPSEQGTVGRGLLLQQHRKPLHAEPESMQVLFAESGPMRQLPHRCAPRTIECQRLPCRRIRGRER